MLMRQFGWYVVMVWLIAGLSCNENDDPVDKPGFVAKLSATPLNLDYANEGDSKSVAISSNTTWHVSSDATWCQSNIQTSKGDANIKIIVDANDVESERTTIVTLSAQDVEDVNIAISQEAKEPDPIEPEMKDSIAPDKTGMADNALELASKMFAGWNLGNTLEATGGETAWGNPIATQELIDAVKNAGFNTVRIPCSWDQYLENQSTYKIKDFWLERVKDVVDYCIVNDMYVMLNIHWDGGWLENNVTSEKQVEVNAKQDSIWKQIAIYFRDYDQHLLFAGANEPHVENQEQADVLQSYLQTFINAVRGTGGRNTYRHLIVQGPSTDIEKTDKLMNLPNDPTPNRLMAEVHYYTPWQFCGLTEDAGWGKMYYFWGEPYHLVGAEDRYPNWNSEEDYVLEAFGKMKAKFVDQQVPVILGEYGTIRRTDIGDETWQQKHYESRAYFNEFVTEQAKNYGLVPMYWDEGSLIDNGFGFVNRSTNEVGDQALYEAIMKGANAGKYPY